jgi:hypothetical protein
MTAVYTLGCAPLHRFLTHPWKPQGGSEKNMNSTTPHRYLDEDEACRMYASLLADPTTEGIHEAFSCMLPGSLLVHVTQSLGVNFVVLNPGKVREATGGNPMPVLDYMLTRKDIEGIAQTLLRPEMQEVLKQAGRYAELFRRTYIQSGMDGHTCWVWSAHQAGITVEQTEEMILERLEQCLRSLVGDEWTNIDDRDWVWAFFEGPHRQLTVDAHESNLFGLTDEGLMKAARRIMVCLDSPSEVLRDWRRIAVRLAARPDLQEALWAEVMGMHPRLDNHVMGELTQLQPELQESALAHAKAFEAPRQYLDTWQYGGCEAFRLLIRLCLARDLPAAQQLFEEVVVKFDAFDPIKLLQQVCRDQQRRSRNRDESAAAILGWMRELLEPRAIQAGYGLGVVVRVGGRDVGLINDRLVTQLPDCHRYFPCRGDLVAVRLTDLTPSTTFEGSWEAELIHL